MNLPPGVHRSTTAFALALALCLSACSDPSTGPGAGRAGSTPMVIEPNLAVGAIRAGMTVNEIATKLGQPQRRTANSLEYTDLGLAVMPGPDGVVKVVMCGDVMGLNRPFAAHFSGRTQEGIGLGSTREEVVRAFGQPTESEKLRGSIESLKYASLGITFSLEGGKVYHLIVRLGDPQEPDRTVTLEPAVAGPAK